MWWHKLAAAFFFLGLAVLGYQISVRSWGGTIFVTNNMYRDGSDDHRSPAAIRKVYDFSNLEGSALTSALQNRLLSDVKVVQSTQDVGVELGHFVTRDQTGEKIFACEYYNKIELTFMAEGVMESGERPAMIVEGDCHFSANINRIDPIWIPVAKILKERPGNMDLTFNDKQMVSMRFKNIGAFWPKYWTLRNIRLFNAGTSGQEVSVGEAEMRRLFSRLIPVNF